jgi:hypothetical protein
VYWRAASLNENSEAERRRGAALSISAQASGIAKPKEKSPGHEMGKGRGFPGGSGGCREPQTNASSPVKIYSR